MLQHLNIRVQGKVHGVSFRYHAQHKAERLGLAGFARNEDEPESVYIEAEGEEAALQEFVDWCRRGPTSARVDGAEAKAGALKGLKGFYIEE